MQITCRKHWTDSLQCYSVQSTNQNRDFSHKACVFSFFISQGYLTGTPFDGLRCPPFHHLPHISYCTDDTVVCYITALQLYINRTTPISSSSSPLYLFFYTKLEIYFTSLKKINAVTEHI